MKPKPLKNKEEYFLDYMKTYDGKNERFYWKKDIKSAVEWLKQKLIEGGIHQHKPISVMTFNKILKEAFEDVK